MTARKFSIIIPTFNSARTIKSCLSSLAAQKVKPFEVIIVDGGSSDMTIKIVSGFRDVVILSNEASNYPGASRNLGVEGSKGDTILFVDSDCVADRLLLAYHQKCFLMDVSLDGVQGVIRATKHNEFSRTIERQFLTQYWFDNLNDDGTIKLYSVAVCNLSLDREIFLENKFSADMMSCDDVELFIKLRSKKVKILLEPRAVVYHPHPNNLQQIFSQRKWYGGGFVELFRKYPKAQFRKKSMFHTSLRYLNMATEDLIKAVFVDHRWLCEKCPLGMCRIEVERLPVHARLDEQYLRQITCLGFAAGTLKTRVGLDYEWLPDARYLLDQI